MCHIDHDFLSIKSFFLCIQHAISSIITISSKRFELNVNYAKVDQFSEPSLKK